MNDYDFMDEARELASQYLYDSHFPERDKELTESVARMIAVWMQTAAQNQRNADFYRDIVHQCADNLGELAPSAYVSDDGSIQDEPLALKVPGLVKSLADSVSHTRNGVHPMEGSR